MSEGREEDREEEIVDGCNCGECQPMEKIVEDPLVKFLKRHQNAILNILLAVLVCYTGFQFYTKSVREAQQAAADSFNDLRREVVELIGTDGQLKEITPKIKSSIEEKLNALSHEKEPYNTLALAYKNLYQLRTGELKDYDGALAAISAVPNSKKPYSDGKIFAEMAELLVLRSELDEDAAKAFNGLVDMAKNAQYLKLLATLTVAHVAESEEEREIARSLLEGMKSDEVPEHVSLIEAELEQLG